jgi:cardiolipin synthase (CMP-forming)
LVNLPNLFTLLRLVLTPFIAIAILSGTYDRGIFLLLLAGISDFIDGFLARRLSASTSAGAYFDPIADKILLVAIYLALGFARAIPAWMVVIVFARDLLILAMAAYGLLFTDVRRFPPSIWGKVSTFLQILAALMVMLDHAGIRAPTQIALWQMVAATIWSGFHYAWRGIMILRTKTN